MLVNSSTDPVNLGVTSDSLMEGVHADDLVEFKGRILANPVGAQDSEGLGHPFTQSRLGNGLVIPDWLQLVDTLILGLSVNLSLEHLLSSTTSSNLDSIDNKPLFGSVSQPSGLLGSRGSRTSVNCIQLSILPAPDSKKEGHHVRLLLAPDFLHVLVRSHG